MVRLLPLGHECRLTGTSTIELELQFIQVELHSRWTPLNHGAQSSTVALAKGGDAEQSTNSRAHDAPPGLSLLQFE